MIEPVIAIIPARMGSSRLPGKMLEPIAGQPLLGHVIDRVSLVKHVGNVVVATSDRATDDPIAAYCESRAVTCFRGPEDDVLKRLTQALTQAGAVTGVLVFGDQPLVVPEIVTRLIDIYAAERGHVDFVGNDLKTTFPPGMEAEVFSVAALQDADSRCDSSEIREHGTLFIRMNPRLYRLKNVEATGAERRPDLEIEVDVAADLTVIEAILAGSDLRPDAPLSAIIRFLDAHPDICRLNQSVPRRWRAYRQDT